ncbi:hypothetical protein C5167_046248 [Papaver somniferum]|uniref:Uncharacterized protein n=1 Tax=Papaver somniferum TaxID=3469 RepID=A0A4Y7LFJ5_PAPSO|nr:hypothetical protein C5167_046248 [Papaver somniferum]
MQAAIHPSMMMMMMKKRFGITGFIFVSWQGDKRLVKRKKIPRKHFRSSNEAYVEDPEDAAEDPVRVGNIVLMLGILLVKLRVTGVLLYKTTTHEDYFTSTPL